MPTSIILHLPEHFTTTCQHYHINPQEFLQDLIEHIQPSIPPENMDELTTLATDYFLEYAAFKNL